MLTTLYALSCLVSGAVNSPETIVFPATRYHWRGRHVYPSGSSHLYSVHLDGSHLHALTHGPGDDQDPHPSLDGRHIIFLRTHGDSDPFAICSIDLDGRHFQKLASAQGEISAKLSEARILAGRPLPFKLINYWDDGHYALLDSKGKTVGQWVEWIEPRFSADWTAVLVGGNSLVDLRTGRQNELPTPSSSVGFSGSGSWAWLDETTFLARFLDESKQDGTGAAALAGRDGKIRLSLKTKQARDQEHREHGNDFQRQWGVAESARLAIPWPNHPDSVVTWNSIGFSSGSAGYTSILNLKTGDSLEVDDQHLDGVTQDGRHLVTATWEWRGGYHEPGSEALNRLYVWDTRTWKSKQIGFKWMEIGSDACLVRSRQ